MTPADTPRLAEALGILAVTLDKDLTKALVTAYAAALSDIPIEAVEAACSALARSARWFPKPVEIRELAQQSEASGADEAWAEVLKLLGNCRNASHDDPVVQRVIRRLGGWVHLGTEVTPADLNNWKARDFRRMYAEEKEEQATRARLNPHEAEQIESGEAPRIVAEIAEKMNDVF